VRRTHRGGRGAAGVTTGLGAAAWALAALLAAWSPAPVQGVDRGLTRDLRDTYEGRTLRLRIDLHSAAHSVEPNLLGLTGMAYGRESSPVLFHRMEMVYVDRVVSEGGNRLSLTIYRGETEARNLRANGVPAPSFGNPAAAQTTAAFARSDSTSVVLQVNASRKDPDAQHRELTELIARLFYVDAEPSREEIEAFVLQHRDWTVPRLAAVTGLTRDQVRALVTDAPRPPE